MFVETKKEGEAPVKQAPSVQGLIAWLETKNQTETYPYMDCKGGCLLGQYLNAIGMPWDGYESGPGYEWWRWMPEGSALHILSARTPHTFGAALQRARALLD